MISGSFRAIRLCHEVDMKQKSIEIFLFIDALGWKIVNDHKFLEDLLQQPQSLGNRFSSFADKCAVMWTEDKLIGNEAHRMKQFHYPVCKSEFRQIIASVFK